MGRKAAKQDSDGTGLVALDPSLEPYRQHLRERYGYYQTVLSRFTPTGGLLGQISQGHRYFGFNRGQRDGKDGVWYREWAPGALALHLAGDFNGWDRSSHPLECDDYGVWSLFLPDAEYAGRLTHQSLLKVQVTSTAGTMDRIPAYTRRVVHDEHTHNFTAQYWNPPQAYRFDHPAPTIRGALRIYEAHVGMAQEEPRIGTFAEFTRNVLPRIAALGYNAIQLMAIMEHPFYGSFGYQVSNFYAVSSRFGEPDELKALIDAAHGMGLVVLLDLVHSHAVKNTQEGLGLLDGTDHQYFHCGARGQHPAWDSLLFDYGKYEVQRFLLSNVRYWLEEYHFDGFRFDGVTSMMYMDHGLNRHFTRYDDYFDANVDRDAVAYLQLANQLVHSLNERAVTIAEDVSGMAGMARSVEEGGIGFDYRLAMALPDYWIKVLKERRDEQWDLQEMEYVLHNRRRGEKHVAYAESHDQALVGDQTIAFRLMAKEMYWHMARDSSNQIIERGIALHKMIRLVTFCLGGEALSAAV